METFNSFGDILKCTDFSQIRYIKSMKIIHIPEWLFGKGGRFVTSVAFPKGAHSLGNIKRTLHPPEKKQYHNIGIKLYNRYFIKYLIYFKNR